GFRIVYTSFPNWPLPPLPHLDEGSDAKLPRYIDVAVLDSSFNPPTRAHLALARSEPRSRMVSKARCKPSYDSRLLLFSSSNADKGTLAGGEKKPRSPDLEQRVEMMRLLARDVEEATTFHGDLHAEDSASLAVGLVDQPLFFEKSSLIRDEIERSLNSDEDGTRGGQAPFSLRLHWLVGFDTLYRVFQLKYYRDDPELLKRSCQRFFQEEGSTFVCARRSKSSFPSTNDLPSSPSASRDGQQGQTWEDDERRDEVQLLEGNELVRPWFEEGFIDMLDLDEVEKSLSSTSVRAIFNEIDQSCQERRDRLRAKVPESLVDYLDREAFYE
ncbi:hypothetical protein IE53DRAFT_301759, partial [Violaceomyces palustris]